MARIISSIGPNRSLPAASDLIPRREVQNMTSLSASAIYRLMQSGLFPRPIRISPMRVAWLHGEVRGWIEQQVAEQRACEEVDHESATA